MTSVYINIVHDKVCLGHTRSQDVNRNWALVRSIIQRLDVIIVDEMNSGSYMKSRREMGIITA